MDIKKFVANLDLAVGESIRLDCPVCGGDKTFSVSHTYDGLVWHCYRASCSLRGFSPLARMGVDALRRVTQGVDPHPTPFAIPEHWLPPTYNDRAVNYLIKNHCLDAYKERRADIRYDPKLERVVFLLYHEGVCYGAVGRILGRTDAPYRKWHRYDHSHFGFMVPHSVRHLERSERLHHNRQSLLVEDAASACAASSIMDSMALLGTNLPAYLGGFLRKRYQGAVIALDPDAVHKSTTISRQLSWYLPTRIWLIPDDLKAFNKEELTRMATDAGIIREAAAKAVAGP